MKFIIAVIKPSKLQEVHLALSAVGLEGMTVSEVRGYSRQTGTPRSTAGPSTRSTSSPRPGIEIAVEDGDVQRVVETIARTATPGRSATGRFFVLELSEAMRVRTGETGPSALGSSRQEPSNARARHRQHRLDAHRHRPGAVHDPARAGPLLRRAGPDQERPLRPDAVLLHHRAGDRPVGGLRLLAGLHPEPLAGAGPVHRRAGEGLLRRRRPRLAATGRSRRRSSPCSSSPSRSSPRRSSSAPSPSGCGSAPCCCSWRCGRCMSYVPVAHWMWGGGWLQEKLGALDFAGGIVVLASSGGRRRPGDGALRGTAQGVPGDAHAPAQPDAVGGGRGHAVDGVVRLQRRQRHGRRRAGGNGGGGHPISAGTAAMVWLFVEWKRRGRPSVLGIVTGAVAGLATITTGSGYVGAGGALVSGWRPACSASWAPPRSSAGWATTTRSTPSGSTAWAGWWDRS